MVDMNFEEAKAKLKELFPILLQEGNIRYLEIPLETYVEIMNAVNDSIPFSNQEENDALCCFLFFACQRFNRWVATSAQYVLPPGFQETFAQLVSLYSIAEGNRPGYSPALKFTVIKNNLLDTFDLKPIKDISIEKLQHFRAMAEMIGPPINPSREMQEAFEEQRESLFDLITGIENGDRKSVV